MEAFVDTPFANAIKQLIKSRDWKGDYFHVNAIEPYDTRNPIAILGKNQVLISVRNMDALATLDLASGKIAWLLQGGWQKQHDPDIVNGHILLFDNRGDFARGGKSRVLEFDPITQEIIWQASVGAGYELYSGWGSNQQVLPNGNVMIVESAPGRMLELTRDGKVAWEYYSTTRDEEGKFATALLEARRYAPDEITFELGGKIQPQATP
jgi:outer membrane protein assembly factor BamB